MRTKRFYFAGALTLVSALAVAGVSSASHGVQPADVFFTATGKATAKGAPGSLDIRLGPAADDPSTVDVVPPKPSQVRVDLSQGITINGGPFPTCTTAELEGKPPTGPGSAQEACGNEAPKADNALIATGDAKATIPTGAPGTTAAEVDTTALAFNGPGGAVIVYARTPALNVTTIVPCSLGSAPDQALYKTRFICEVPPLAAGAGALTTFNLKFLRVEKKKKGKSAATASKKKKKKKVNSIIVGKCPASGSYSYQVSWDYTDHASESRQITQAC